MKLFFSCQNYRFALNVSQTDTVGSVMERLREKASIIFDDSSNTRLVPYYAGSYLQKEWPIMDIGIPQGSTIRCYLRQELKPSLYVYCNFNRQLIDINEPLNVPQTPVHQLRSIITDLTGLPLSCYCLISPYRRVMNDSDKLLDHLVDEGMTVRLETIKGLDEFFHAACAGKVRDILQLMPANRLERHYLCKVALFIASHNGHYDLTGTMLSMGYLASQPPGFHPTINWCLDRTHFGHLTTPLHQAAMKDNISILRLSLLNNLVGITCQDGFNQTPLQVAIKYNSQQSVQYLKSQLRRYTDHQNGLANSRYPSKNKFHHCRYQHYNPEKLFEIKTLAQVGRIVEEKDGQARFTVDSQRYRLQDYDDQEEFVVVDDEHGQPKLVKRSSIDKSSLKNGQDHSLLIKSPSSSPPHRRKAKKSTLSASHTYHYRTAKVSKATRAKTAVDSLMPIDQNPKDKQPFHPAFLHVDNHAEVQTNFIDEKLTQSTNLPTLPTTAAISSGAIQQQASFDSVKGYRSTTTAPTLSKSISLPSSSSFTSQYNSRLKSETSLEDFERYRGQNAREKALACMDIATTFKSKPWLKQIQLAVKLNVSSCKRSMNSIQFSNISKCGTHQ